ncbi:uncharacterized protein LOC133832223 [Humulus lupulus]|uniref:uncharacterized protein LOC133832223 n=1 Tax=Humulus lupulus TaxID=3486 RepID=UPI002B4128A0|nr:uncharacterized protein LOC133832223 [Humulus lupulus]
MTCVRTPRYSLLLGGSIHGFFEAKRGLRQGDPLSPLLFVICMEYLSRILAKVACKHDFHFHHRCTELKLTHLCFADNIILFCRGDIISILRLLQGFKWFSVSSGLQANVNKSAFYCHGMPEEDVKRIHLASGFSKSQLPFRYLGIPICFKRLSMAECSVLAEKMLHRIRIWSSRHLSLAAWGIVCKRRIDGGLGVKDIFLWNLAAMGKHVWHISMNKESLWVKWVHVVYLRGLEWWEYSATNDSSCKPDSAMMQFGTGVPLCIGEVYLWNTSISIGSLHVDSYYSVRTRSCIIFTGYVLDRTARVQRFRGFFWKAARIGG